MRGYGPQTYGELIADIYDDLYPQGQNAEAAAALLTDLAGDGPALELVIGTGRIALAPSKRGVEVHGIDASEAMITGLRAKPGGEQLAVTLGNFADVDIDGCYRLIYVVFSTFFALLTRQEQVRCFRNVAAHLDDGGMFLIEAFARTLAHDS
jgi:hypothetical protein